MRIEQLEYIAAVTRHGSLRRASEELHISQPALSEAVSKLERELGVALLDRNRSGTRISRQGRDLLPDMTEVLDAVRRLRSAAGDQLSATGTVRIGAVHTTAPAVLLPAVDDLRRLAPRTTVEITIGHQRDIHRSIVDGGLDLGLVTALPGDDLSPELYGTELISGRPVVCCRADSDVAANARVDLPTLAGQPLIAPRPGEVMRRVLTRLYDGDPPPVAYATDDAETVQQLVAEGLGVAVLPDHAVEHQHRMPGCDRIVQRPIAGDRTTIRLLLLRRRAGRASVAAGSLAAAIAERALARRTHREPA